MVGMVVVVLVVLVGMMLMVLLVVVMVVVVVVVLVVVLMVVMVLVIQVVVGVFVMIVVVVLMLVMVMLVLLVVLELVRVVVVVVPHGLHRDYFTLSVSLKVPSVTCEILDTIITLTADFSGPVLNIRNYVRNYCCRRCVIKVMFCFVRDCFSHQNHISLSYTTCFFSEQEHMYRRLWHTGKRNRVLLF